MSDEISYHNKDIEFKFLSDGYKEKSFHVYGLDLPKIKALLPTNLPWVVANEKRIDNLFLLEDGSLAIVDYEAVDKLENYVKYVNYIARVMERYFKETGFIDIKMIVIYTGDVEEANNTLKTTSLTLKIEQIFLSKLDGESIYQSIKHKVERKEHLSDEDLMQMIILPLTDKGIENKQKRIEQIVELAKTIDDDEIQVFVIAGLLVSTDKFINKQYAETVKERMKMNKVFQLFEEEKLDAVRAAEKRKAIEYTIKMLLQGMEIFQIMDITGLTKIEIEEIRDDLIIKNQKSKRHPIRP